MVIICLFFFEKFVDEVEYGVVWFDVGFYCGVVCIEYLLWWCFVGDEGVYVVVEIDNCGECDFELIVVGGGFGYEFILFEIVFDDVGDVVVEGDNFEWIEVDDCVFDGCDGVFDVCECFSFSYGRMGWCVWLNV